MPTGRNVGRKLAVAFAGMVLSACGHELSTGTAPTSTAGEADLEPRSVQTALALVQSWPRRLRVTAEFAAHEEVTVSCEVAGRVEELRADLGMRVESGFVLARLRKRELELAVAAAEAALAVARARLGGAWNDESDNFDAQSTVLVRQAQTELDEAEREHARLVALAEEGVSTQAELDRAKTRLRRAEGAMENALQEVLVLGSLHLQRRAELDLAREALSRAEISAPFAGVIAQRLVGPGDFVVRGTGLYRLLRDDPLRLRLRVSERDAGLLRVGQRVLLPAQENARLLGNIGRLAPAIAGQGRTLLAEVDVDNNAGEWRAGSFVEVEVVVDENSQALCIPASALVSFAGIDKVFTIEEERAKEMRVVVGRRSSERLEILSGLSPAAIVVLSPGRLQSGHPLRVER